jgi:hypothetical protein
MLNAVFQKDQHKSSGEKGSYIMLMELTPRANLLLQFLCETGRGVNTIQQQQRQQLIRWQKITELNLVLNFILQLQLNNYSSLDLVSLIFD